MNGEDINEMFRIILDDEQNRDNWSGELQNYLVVMVIERWLQLEELLDSKINEE